MSCRPSKAQTKAALRAAGGGKLAQLVELASAGGMQLLTAVGADDCQCLHRAAAAGHHAVVEYLLAQGADPDARKSKCKTPLHEAAAAGHAHVLRLLLEAGALISAHKTNGWTPLMYSCARGDVDCCALLLSHGANLRDRNRDGQTSFYLACREGHDTLVTQLLSPSTPLPSTGTTPYKLAAAAAVEPFEAAAAAAAVVPLPAMRTRNNKTALHGAAINGHAAVLRTLLAHGADTGAADLCGATPLFDAVAHGHMAAVDVLLLHSPVVSAAMELEGRALALAPEPEAGPTESCCVRNVDLSGRGTLHAAIVGESMADVEESTRKEIICRLLEASADVNARDDDGGSALYWACAQGYASVVETLLAARAEPEAGTQRRTPLQLAVGWRRPAVVALLLKAGASAEVVLAMMDNSDGDGDEEEKEDEGVEGQPQLSCCPEKLAQRLDTCVECARLLQHAAAAAAAAQAAPAPVPAT
jgi:ankyrin repeat protein